MSRKNAAVTANMVSETGCAKMRDDKTAGTDEMRVARRNRRGVSIFGVILGVAVTAIVILGLVSAYQTVVTSTRSQTTLSTIGTMENTIRRNYANLPQFGGALEAGLYGAVPSTSVQGTGTNRRIVTPWGSQIIAGGGNGVATLNSPGGAASNDNFFITVGRPLPEAACEAIATAHLNRSDVAQLYIENDDTAATGTAIVPAFANPGDLIALTPVVTAAGSIETACEGNTNNYLSIIYRG